MAHRALSPANARRGARGRVDVRTVLLLATLLGLAVTPVLASNGARLTAYGVRAAGRGGVDYAFADDATGPATNPAGMAFIPNRIDETWVAAQADVDYRNQFGDFHMAPQTNIAIPAYSFGVVFDPDQSWHVGDLFDLGNWGLRHPSSAQDAPEESWESEILRPKHELADTAPPSQGVKDSSVPGASVPGASVPGASVPGAAPASDAEPSDEELYGGRLRLGFGIFPVKGGTFTFNGIMSPFWAPQAPEYTTAAQSLAVTPSIAFRFGKYFSIGLAPQFHYGTLKLTGPIEQPRSILQPEFQTASTLVNSATVQTYANSHHLVTLGFSERIGAMFNTPVFSVGATYQDRTYLQDYLGTGDVDATAQILKLTFNSPGVLSIIDPRVNTSLGFHSKYNMRVVNAQGPRQVGLGFAIRPFDRLSLGFDYTWIHWSEVMRVLRVRLNDASNSNLDVLTGKTVHVTVPLEWHDQHVFAAGGSLVVLQGDDIIPDVPSYKLILRMGYNWAQKPYSAKNSLPQTPVFFEHHASVGVTFQWGPYVDFSVAYEHAFFSSMHTKFNATDSDLSNSHETAYLDTLFAGIGANF